MKIEVTSTEEFERIEKVIIQLMGPLLRVVMDMQTLRGAAFFGVIDKQGWLRPQPVRVKVRIDDDGRQIGIRMLQVSSLAVIAQIVLL
jgi:hypothetical protein